MTRRGVVEGNTEQDHGRETLELVMLIRKSVD